MIFESIAPDNPKTNSFRYISIKPEVLEAAGEYEKALDAYKNSIQPSNLKTQKYIHKKRLSLKNFMK